MTSPGEDGGDDRPRLGSANTAACGAAQGARRRGGGPPGAGGYGVAKTSTKFLSAPLVVMIVEAPSATVVPVASTAALTAS